MKVKSAHTFKSTAIVGSPNSIANLGSLAIDILINSQNAVKVGQIYSELLDPFVGKMDGSLYSNCEIYNSKQYSLIIFRSPASKGYGLQFSGEFGKWLSETFERVIFLTGLDQTKQNDGQIARLLTLISSPLRIYGDGRLSSEIKQLEAVDQIQPYPTVFPPGAGLLNFIIKSLKVPYYVLMYFTENGNNSEASLTICRALALNEGLDLELNIPKAWKYLDDPGVDYTMY